MARNGIGKALIVGGGVGGMAAAITLAGDGTRVLLVDIDPTWRAAGAGLTLNGATLRALKMLGVLDEVVASGHVHGGRRTFRADGAPIGEVPYYAPAADDLLAGGGILRPDLHRILAARVGALDVEVRLGLTVDRLETIGDAVEAVFSDGSSGRFDLAVGADGITSRTRDLIMPEAPKPAFTGQGCWRAVFDRPDEVRTNWIFVDANRKVGFNPVSVDKMYMFMLEAAPGNPWRDQSEWPAMLAERMRGYGGIVHELADQVSEASFPNYRPLETLLLDTPWHRGRVVLIGDAAHATTPHAGYGAGLAIEDGIALAHEIAAHAELQAALTAFAARRHPRCREVIDRSLALGEMEMAGAPAEAQIAASGALFALTRADF